MKYKIVLMVGFILVGGLFITACSQLPPEDAIISAIKENYPEEIFGVDYTVEILEIRECEKVNKLKTWPVKFRVAQIEEVQYCRVVKYKGQYDAMIFKKEFMGSTWD